MKNVLPLAHDDEEQEARLQGVAGDFSRALSGYLTLS